MIIQNHLFSFLPSTCCESGATRPVSHAICKVVPCHHPASTIVALFINYPRRTTSHALATVSLASSTLILYSHSSISTVSNPYFVTMLILRVFYSPLRAGKSIPYASVVKASLALVFYPPGRPSVSPEQFTELHRYGKFFSTRYIHRFQSFNIAQSGRRKASTSLSSSA